MNKYIDQYYKDFGIAKIPNKEEVLKNEELYNLYKKPKKDKGKEMPHVVGVKPKVIYQCDLLYMPTDKDYSFVLVVVDISTGFTDCYPLKSRTAKETLEAMKKILLRNPLKGGPKYKLECDNGSEFKKEFRKYFEDKDIVIRYGKPGRSRNQAFAESRNNTIATKLFQRMTAEELINGEKSVEWVDDLPIIVNAINKYLKKNSRKVPSDIDTYTTQDTILLDTGDKVRVMLDKPQEATGDKIGNQRFRATDIRWNPKISTVTNVIFGEGPILYQVDDKPTSYTYNQLQFVRDTEKKPPTSVLRKYLVEKIVGKKMQNNKIYYEVQWKGFPNKKDNTWEPKTELIKNPLIKKLIDDYN